MDVPPVGAAGERRVLVDRVPACRGPIPGARQRRRARVLPREFGIEPPDPAVPLSELGIFLDLEFPPGGIDATLSLPIAADGVTEPAEGVVLLLDGFGDPVVPVPIELTGEVPRLVSGRR